ncbi:MAG: PAS domain S-box protein [Nitrospiraceae bacterium]|nr:MAG: PAS domain S-box protein [Nitrospiraceae bacterium]
MQQNNFVKIMMLSLFTSIGLFIGIVVALGGGEKQFGPGIAVLLVSAGAFSAVTIYMFRQKNAAGTPERFQDHSQVGFVVDTFQELVGQLKEKENELEKLRAFAEEKAVSIEAYNENVLQSVPSGVISVDNGMKIKSLNQAAEHMLAMEAGKVIGKDFTDVFKGPFVTLMKKDSAVARAEYPYIAGDGRHIWLGISTSELKNAAGEKIGLIFVFTDLTDIKTLQAQMELKERLSQLGEMSAGISHELRNSMSVISGYARLLAKKAELSDRVTVDAIVEEIRLMDRIISELLAFAKPTVLSTEQVDLNELIRETAASVTGGHKGISVSINSDGHVSVKADAVLLRQALSNLFINAVEAMPGGGSIDIRLRCIRNRAEISIRDTGCGIPEDIRRKMFLPFYTTKQGGFGLGLALVQKIVVSHGGGIEADSKEGEGTLFTVTLPGAEHDKEN